MKIKVGDWVKHEDKKVGKVIHVYGGENNGWAGVMFSVGCMDDVQMHALTKLPIKFKPFQIKQGEEDIAYIIEETRVLHKNTRAIKFKAVQIHEGGLCEVILHTDGKTQTRWEKNSKTIEQAKDWLELQYATMIAKARSLI